MPQKAPLRRLASSSVSWSRRERIVLVGVTLRGTGRVDDGGMDDEVRRHLERLHSAVGNSIALHKYLGAELPTKPRRGLDYTLGAEVVELRAARCEAADDPAVDAEVIAMLADLCKLRCEAARIVREAEGVAA